MKKSGFIEILLPCLVVAIAAGIGLGYTYFSRVPDNPVEEICEEVIRDETGVEIDLSPSSPEKKA